MLLKLFEPVEEPSLVTHNDLYFCGLIVASPLEESLKRKQWILLLKMAKIGKM